MEFFYAKVQKYKYNWINYTKIFINNNKKNNKVKINSIKLKWKNGAM